MIPQAADDSRAVGHACEPRMTRIAEVARSCRRRFPSHLTCCWALLGAAICISLLYSLRVYYSQAKDNYYFPFNFIDFEVATHEERARMLRPPDSSGSVRLFGLLAWEGVELEPGGAQRIVNRWYFATAVVIGLTGACLGLLVARLCKRRLPPVFPDLRLWFVITSLLFVTLVRFGLPGERWSVYRSVGQAIQNSRGSTVGMSFGSELMQLSWSLFCIWVPAAMVGWSLQMVLVSFGIRIPRRRLPDQASDYDDRARPSLPAPE